MIWMPKLSTFLTLAFLFLQGQAGHAASPEQFTVLIKPHGRTVGQELSVYGSLVTDSQIPIPQGVAILTVTHGKKVLCQHPNDLIDIAIEPKTNRAQTISVPCTDYDTSSGIDVAYIFLRDVDAATASKLKSLSTYMTGWNSDKDRKPFCPLTEKIKLAVNPEYVAWDGRYLQVVTNNIPGCSGTALVTSKNAVAGVFKGIALENNRSLFEPLTMKALAPLLQDAKKRNVLPKELEGKLKEIQNYQRAGTRVDPLDGNPLLATSNFRTAIPQQFIGSKIFSSYPLMQLADSSVANGSTLTKISHASYSKDHPMLSCTYSHNEVPPLKTDGRGLPVYPFDFSKFNRGQVGARVHFYFNGEAISYPAENAARASFGDTNKNFLWQMSSANRFSVQVAPGKLTIRDKDFNEDLVFTDPNVCTRTLTAQSPKTGLYVHYNISMSVFEGLLEPCLKPYASLIVKRATSKGASIINYRAADFEYLEIQTDVGDVNGRTCAN